MSNKSFDLETLRLPRLVWVPRGKLGLFVIAAAVVPIAYREVSRWLEQRRTNGTSGGKDEPKRDMSESTPRPPASNVESKASSPSGKGEVQRNKAAEAQGTNTTPKPKKPRTTAKRKTAKPGARTNPKGPRKPG